MRQLTLMGKSTTVNDPVKRKSTPFEQLSDPLASKDHVSEIAHLLVKIENCDAAIEDITRVVEKNQVRLESIFDPWDKEKLEENIADDCQTLQHLSDQVYMAAGDIAAHVQYLVRENRKDAIFLLAQQVTPEIWERVKVEVPGLMTGMGWMELRGGDCQF